MSKLFILPFVKQQEVAVIYQKFDPFPVQSRIIYWFEKVLKGLEYVIACFAIIGLFQDNQKVVILLVVCIAMYATICILTLFWGLRLDQEKSKRFIETNPRLR
jgi:hypothetical protein